MGGDRDWLWTAGRLEEYPSTTWNFMEESFRRMVESCLGPMTREVGQHRA